MISRLVLSLLSISYYRFGVNNLASFGVTIYFLLPPIPLSVAMDNVLFPRPLRSCQCDLWLLYTYLANKTTCLTNADDNKIWHYECTHEGVRKKG